MEIRLLQDEEIGNAVWLSRLVFDNCLRNRMEFPQTITYVEKYLTENNLRSGKAEGVLLLWGAFEYGQLIGVGGMQNDGLITMLYVLPQNFGRGCGAKLLDQMRIYAKEVLRLAQVSVNANPAFTSYYFEKQGFKTLTPRQGGPVPYVSMYATSDSLQVYQKKRIPGKVIAALVIGGILFATALGSGFMIWYLF